MKKAMLVMSLLFVGQSVRAWEFQGNPDKVPSVGIVYNRLDLSGDYKAITGYTNWDISKGATFTQNSFTVDTRLPVSDMLTLFGGIGYTKLEIGSRDNTFIVFGGSLFDYNVPTKQYLSGYNLNLGARIYFR